VCVVVGVVCVQKRLGGSTGEGGGLGHRRGHRCPTDWNQRRVSGGAKGRDLGEKTREKARGHLVMPESTMDAAGICRLRREILPAWRHDLEREEGEMKRS
jgi:hypothetical protein